MQPFRVVVTLLFVLALPALAAAQSDPLSSSYLPSIDRDCEHYPDNVWITSSLYKLRQDSGTAPPCPSLFGNKWGTFYGTQNEFIDFQVHVHDVGGGTPGLNLTVSNFVQSSPNKYTIPSATNSVPFNVIVYREAYLNIKNVTASSVTFYGSTGHYPDILIPAVDPYYGQSTNAFPFTISPGNNQSVWIDVHIPSTAPPGYYRGTVTLQKDCPRMCTTITTLQIIIGVWQWPSAGYMPSTSSLASYEAVGYLDFCNQFFNGSYASCAHYPGSGGSSERALSLGYQQLAVLMLDHRRSMITTNPPITSGFSTWETYYKSLMNGTNPSALEPMLSGARYTTMQFSSASGYVNPDIQNWLTEFSHNSWYSATAPIFYPVDEPQATCSKWTAFTQAASIAHGNSPRGQMLVTAKFSDANTCNTLGAIDVMVVPITEMERQGGSLQRASYDKWLSGGSNLRLWSYQACSSTGTCANGTTGGSRVTYPNLDVDGVPVANRAFEWLTFLHNQSGELYYDDTYCWNTFIACGYPSGTTDPWTSVYAFGGNGDGTLVYPTTSGTTNHVTASAGRALSTPLFLPSIRLKLVRDGMQDYEYLNKLTNLGYGSLAKNQVASWIRNSYTFEITGSGLQAARMTLGMAMHQLSYPILVSPPH